MKQILKLLKKYTIKAAWLVSFLFLLWVVYLQYQVYNEAILNPPTIEHNQVTARQTKVNNKVIETVEAFHKHKINTEQPETLKYDPFGTIELDSLID